MHCAKDEQISKLPSTSMYTTGLLITTYCFDISDIALPSTKNVYSNNRHHNERGNEIIANKIFKIINQRN